MLEGGLKNETTMTRRQLRRWTWLYLDDPDVKDFMGEKAVEGTSDEDESASSKLGKRKRR